VFTLISDGERVELARVGTVEHADRLAVEAVPVGHFAVRAASEEL
jgi:hypothetical protein